MVSERLLLAARRLLHRGRHVAQHKVDIHARPPKVLQQLVCENTIAPAAVCSCAPSLTAGSADEDASGTGITRLVFSRESKRVRRGGKSRAKR
jgi:hypothetical protein